MIVGILREQNDGRVAMVPQVVGKLEKLGFTFALEHSAGESAGYPDSAYPETVKFYPAPEVIQQSDILVSVNPPDENRLATIPAGKYLISSFAPFQDDTIISILKNAGVKAFSLDMIPRITLAQSMDVLSSMASIAGYRAVLVAAEKSNKYFPMMITAAGSIKPTRVLIIGAGVAGLQAIATAKRLGAIVEAFDTRSAVRDEVKSLGAKFVEVEGAVEDAAAGGYAVEQTEDYLRKQRELVHQKASQSNIVITTAQVRGRKAPIIITAATVENMQPGSIVIDLAASTGGNCELTQDLKEINHKGVTIIGDSDLARGMPQDASFLFSNNIFHFLKHISRDGEIVLNMEDEITKSSYITH